MTKFLKQKCVFERAKRSEDGSVQLDQFGEVIYEPPVTLKCRRERVIKDVQTNTGAILRSSTRYFTDESQPIDADDRFDGKTILEVEEYTNQLGKTEGYESYV
ncbi:MAG: hypothetical protein ACI4T5_10520 [Prevotella sp.]